MNGKLTRSPIVMSLAVLLCLITLALTLAHAQFLRIEMHQVVSTTLTDQQFLTGVTEGAPVTLAGELRIPRPGADRLPGIQGSIPAALPSSGSPGEARPPSTRASRDSSACMGHAVFSSPPISRSTLTAAPLSWTTAMSPTGRSDSSTEQPTIMCRSHHAVHTLRGFVPRARTCSLPSIRKRITFSTIPSSRRQSS